MLALLALIADMVYLLVLCGVRAFCAVLGAFSCLSCALAVLLSLSLCRERLIFCPCCAFGGLRGCLLGLGALNPLQAILKGFAVEPFGF